MKISRDASLVSPSRLFARVAAKAAAATTMLGLVAYSAIIAKEARSAPLLASVSAIRHGTPVSSEWAWMPSDTVTESPAPAPLMIETAAPIEVATVENVEPEVSPEPEAAPAAPVVDPLSTDANVRWFNGRPVKPVRVITMVVTAYSPDARSCGESADGITATLHSVETNGFKLVAADPRVLAYGSMISVPGYDSDRIVPVLDCGGAIKGKRLDVLFPTHEAARKWGVRKVPITVWGYVDGKPAENPRRER